MGVKGYKVFDPDWTCRGFQYEVGKTFKHEGSIGLCKAGFHFCQNVLDCFNYYFFDSNNKVAEVEAIGNVITGGKKSVTDELVILRELTWYEVLDLVNAGENCTGYRNGGDRNSGNRNGGDYNSGDFNSGIGNSGDFNSGYWNSGNYNSSNGNSGDSNSGYWNSGNYNSGDQNSGDWNSTDYSTGFFNSVEQPLYIFNKPANISRDAFNNLPAVKAMRCKYANNLWIPDMEMTDEEKIAHPEYKTTGGYLKTVDFKTACNIMWDSMTWKEKVAVKDIPNFNAEVFKDITGIVVD